MKRICLLKWNGLWRIRYWVNPLLSEMTVIGLTVVMLWSQLKMYSLAREQYVGYVNLCLLGNEVAFLKCSWSSALPKPYFLLTPPPFIYTLITMSRTILLLQELSKNNGYLIAQVILLPRKNTLLHTILNFWMAWCCVLWYGNWDSKVVEPRAITTKKTFPQYIYCFRDALESIFKFNSVMQEK